MPWSKCVGIRGADITLCQIGGGGVMETMRVDLESLGDEYSTGNWLSVPDAGAASKEEQSRDRG